MQDNADAANQLVDLTLVEIDAQQSFKNRITAAVDFGRKLPVFCGTRFSILTLPQLAVLAFQPFDPGQDFSHFPVAQTVSFFEREFDFHFPFIIQVAGGAEWFGTAGCISSAIRVTFSEQIGVRASNRSVLSLADSIFLAR